jgi:hypothetical protein
LSFFNLTSDAPSIRWAAIKPKMRMTAKKTPNAGEITNAGTNSTMPPTMAMFLSVVLPIARVA